MLITTVAPVDKQAQVTLERWRVRETAGGKRYFVGYCVETQTGLVSTVIRSFDIVTGLGTTSSGRRYLLSGWPCFDAEAERIWDRLAEQHDISETKDVSMEYLPALPEKREPSFRTVMDSGSSARDALVNQD